MLYFLKLIKYFYTTILRIPTDTFFLRPTGAILVGRDCSCVLTAAVGSYNHTRPNKNDRSGSNMNNSLRSTLSV